MAHRATRHARRASSKMSEASTFVLASPVFNAAA